MTDKKRKSNFELLRIVSMFKVLLIHYVPKRMIDVTGGGIFLTEYPIQDVINLELRSLAIVCVNCFVLISGYWGIKLRLGSFLNLLFQLMFWSAVCVGLAVSIFDVTNISVGGAFIENIASGWFPKSYLALFVVAPILNSFIKSCSEKELGKYILLFYLLSTVGGYLLRWSDFNEGMSALSLVGLYLIGAYLRITTLKIFTLKARYDMMMYLGLGLLMVILNVMLIIVGVSSSPYGYLNPVVIVMSIYLFLFFKKLNIGYSKVINLLAASAFSIYLFHYNPLVFGEITKVWRWINLNFGVFTSLFITFLSFIAIYLFCVVVDRIRIFIYKHFIEKYILS